MFKMKTLVHTTGLSLLVALLSFQQALAQSAADYRRAVPYLTLRDRTGDTDPARVYGEGRSDLKAGFCFVSEVDLGFLSPAVRAAPFGLGEEILRVDEVLEKPPEVILDNLQESTGTQAPLLYTHGFYVDFEKGCKRAATFQKNAGFEGGLLLFSWPSDGSILNYARDESDLYWSIPDLADVIIELEARFGAGNFNLAGHSLGARGIMLALYHISGMQPDLQAGDVALIAGDIDFGVFTKVLPRIRPLVRSLTIYTAAEDRPLALSAQVHGYPRLGQSGNPVGILPGVEVIDISRLGTSSPTGHLYHIYSEDVGRDIGANLGLGVRAEERDNLMRAGSNLWLLEPER